MACSVSREAVAEWRVPCPERPGPLGLSEATCPTYAAEGGDVRCECGHPATQPGLPPARVSWTSTSESSATLEVRNVSRAQSGAVYTCGSVWGPQGEEEHAALTYTLRVARK